MTRANHSVLPAQIALHGKKIMDQKAVELDRRFIPIAGPDPDEDAEHRLYLVVKRQEPGISWDELLEADASVILGEAGSGKTTELRARAAHLRAKGTAFVVRLESLCRKPVSQSLDRFDVGGEEAFRQWRGRGPATIFLDAIDEARLPDGRNTGPLQDALDRLSDDIQTPASELNVVISTRGSEWQHDADEALIKRFIKKVRSKPGVREATAVEPRLNVVRLASLDADRVARIARSRDVDPERFLQAINDAQVADLARQPQEVQFLLDYWQQQSSRGAEPAVGFTSRTRIFEAAANFRLSGNTEGERRSNLPDHKARNGAEHLAAASLLTGIRDLTPRSKSAEALDPIRILDDPRDPWTEQDVRQLLACGLFAPAFAGRIRFAHRQLADFLAARFFDRAIERDGGSLEVVEPLLAHAFGYTRIRDDTAQCLGWLASFNANARKKLSSIKPALLIETGDPKALAPTERAAALRAHIAQYGNRRYRGEWFSKADMTRFASVELAPDVGALLVTTTAIEARDHLVDLAHNGRMVSLAPQLARIACDPSERFHLRMSAADAVADFGSEADRRAIFSAAVASPKDSDDGRVPWRNGFILAAISAAYPHQIGCQEALQALAEIERERRNMSTSTPDRMAEILDRAPAVDLVTWIEGLTALAIGPRLSDHDRLPFVNPRYVVVAPAIAVAATRLLRNPTTPAEFPCLLHAIEYLAHLDDDLTLPLRHRTPLDELGEALRERPDAKQALLWRRASLFRGKAHNAAWAIIHPLHLKQDRKTVKLFAKEDVEALAAIAATEVPSRRRDLAFELGLAISGQLWNSDDSKSARTILRAAARKSGDPDLKRRVPADSAAKIAYWKYKLLETVKYGRHWQRARDKARTRYWNLRNRGTFLRRRRRIVAGEDAQILRWAVQHGHGRKAAETIEGLKTDYGARVAEDICSGLLKRWRFALPPIQRNTWDQRVGLIGLELEAAKGDIEANAEEARRAFAYGFGELNSLPPWSPNLASRFPAEFLAEVTATLDEELASPAGKEIHPGETLRHLAYSGMEIRRIAANSLLEAVERIDPPNLRVLELVAEILAVTPAADASRVATIARRRFAENAAAAYDRRSWIWLAVWLRLQPEIAWTEALRWIELVWGYGETSPFMGFVSFEGEGFSRHSRKDGARQLHLQCPLVLSGLTKAAYLIAPPETDLEHEDTYSPSARDRAADARRNWRDVLTGLGTQTALNALRSLSNDPTLARYRDEFLIAADRLIWNASSRRVLSVDEAGALIRSHGLKPRTPREFTDLVHRHATAALTRIKTSDDDLARMFRRVRGRSPRDEDDLRSLICDRLRDYGQGIYEPIRDQLVSGAKRPDIRFVPFDSQLGVVSAELKIVDRAHWTGDGLIQAVETQLVDQYMREVRAHAGLFIAVNTEKEKTWTIDARTIDFAELSAGIQDKAQQVSMSHHSRPDVRAIVIDIS